ncbi:hypothetical protein J4218_05720 [Candidatus Pacearchaeota archaeon]|nr:hypothetical protein [Candidatus Pacearchaeota archaeon]
MIDFACKRFELREVIKCGFGLTKSDLRIMDFLIKNKNPNQTRKSGDFYSLQLGRLPKPNLEVLHPVEANKKTFMSNEIASKLNLDLSTAQRSLKNLNEKKLVIRSQNNLFGGGYIYFYKINDKHIIREMMMGIINEWVKKVENELDGW